MCIVCSEDHIQARREQVARSSVWHFSLVSKPQYFPVRYDLSVEEIYRTFQIELLKSGDHSVLLIDGSYYDDLLWACSLNKGQYYSIGYISGTFRYVLDEEPARPYARKFLFIRNELEKNPRAAKTHARKKAKDAKIKMMRDSIRIDGFVGKVEDIARIEEISDVHRPPAKQ